MNTHDQLIVAAAMQRASFAVYQGNPDIGATINRDLIGGVYTDLTTGRTVTWVPSALGRERLEGYVSHANRVAAVQGASAFFRRNMADTQRARAVETAMHQNQDKIDYVLAIVEASC